MFRLPFRAGEPTLAGLDFFPFFTQTVRKYNQKRVTVQYAIQTNGLAIAEEWAEFFSKDHFSWASARWNPDVHDALRPDAQGNGTWDKGHADDQTAAPLQHGVQPLRVSSPSGWPKRRSVYKHESNGGGAICSSFRCGPVGLRAARKQNYSLNTRSCTRSSCVPCLMPGIGTGKQVLYQHPFCLRIIFICLWRTCGNLLHHRYLRCLYGCGRVAVPCTQM